MRRFAITSSATDGDPLEPGVLDETVEPRLGEAEMTMSKPISNPRLAMSEQFQNDNDPALCQTLPGHTQSAGGVVDQVEHLGKKPHIHFSLLDRRVAEVA